MVIMMKNVQISQELFVALLHYHLSGENEYEEVIEQGLEQKLDAMLRHELYAQYKTTFLRDCIHRSVTRSCPLPIEGLTSGSFLAGRKGIF